MCAFGILTHAKRQPKGRWMQHRQHTAPMQGEPGGCNISPPRCSRAGSRQQCMRVKVQAWQQAVLRHPRKVSRSSAQARRKANALDRALRMLFEKRPVWNYRSSDQQRSEQWCSSSSSSSSVKILRSAHLAPAQACAGGIWTSAGCTCRRGAMEATVTSWKRGPSSRRRAACSRGRALRSGQRGCVSAQYAQSC